jgi:hypothetical protein
MSKASQPFSVLSAASTPAPQASPSRANQKDQRL